MNENKIQEFLDDQLSAEEKIDFLDQMKRDPSLKAMVDQYRVLNKLLEADNLLMASPKLSEQVMARISSKYTNPFNLNSLLWAALFFVALSTLPFLIEFTTITEEWKTLDLSKLIGQANLNLWGLVFWGLILIAWLDVKLGAKFRSLVKA